MAAGTDSIEDMEVVRHGGMKHLFDRVYAPSTPGSFLRSFSFGHAGQLDALSSPLMTNLDDHTPLLPGNQETTQASMMVFVDVDDIVIAVHSPSTPEARLGYYCVRGLNALSASRSATPARSSAAFFLLAASVMTFLSRCSGSRVNRDGEHCR